MPFAFPVRLFTNWAYFASLEKSVQTVTDGLAATGRNGEWRLGWPGNFARSRSVAYDLDFDLVNSEGKVIGTRRIRLDFGWGISGGNRIEVSRPSPGTQWVNITADANGITNRLTIKVRAVNGKDPQTANVRISTINGRPPADSDYRLDFFTGELYGIGSNVTNIPVTIWGVPITSIRASAFKGQRLTNIDILAGVTSIKADTFADSQLTSVTIPSSVTSIEAGAFANSRLTSITIPNSVTSIGSSAFANNQLTSVTIGNGVTTIWDKAFADNKQLTYVSIGNSVTSIGDGAFANSQLTSVTIGNGVTTIGNEAFANNRLTSVFIGNGVTTIGNKAFADNKQLTYVNLGNSVIWIGDEAFLRSKLTNVTIPESVTSIGRMAFGLTPDYSSYPYPGPSVIMPANVRVAYSAFAIYHRYVDGYSDEPFRAQDKFEFETVYNKNGKKAGTYYTVDIWPSGYAWKYKRALAAGGSESPVRR
jgi:hypothetical protein